MRLYLDANVIIYLVEAVEPFQSRIRERVFSLSGQSTTTLLTSQLSRLECRSKPLGEKNSALVEMYDHFFSRSMLDVIDISANIIDRATAIRAEYGFKSADSIHIATGISSNADLFLTGDARLSRCSDLRIELF